MTRSVLKTEIQIIFRIVYIVSGPDMSMCAQKPNMYHCIRFSRDRLGFYSKIQIIFAEEQAEQWKKVSMVIIFSNSFHILKRSGSIKLIFKSRTQIRILTHGHTCSPAIPFCSHGQCFDSEQNE